MRLIFARSAFGTAARRPIDTPTGRGPLPGSPPCVIPAAANKPEPQGPGRSCADARSTPRSGALLTYHPQLATLVDLPPEGDRWLHELKHDGYRMGLVLEDGRARVESRRGLDWSASFRELADAAVALPARTLLLDGEACVLQPDGRASFQAMQNSFRGRRSGATAGLLLRIRPSAPRWRRPHGLAARTAQGPAP